MQLSSNLILADSPVQDLPECERIGILARKRGNYNLARQMFKLVVKQLEGEENRQPELIRMTAETAETYEREGAYSNAREWYTKAFLLWERFANKDYMQGACILAKLALLNVLAKDMKGFRKSFERMERAYLLADQTHTSHLVSILIDLSWALCLLHQTPESHAVNELVNQLRCEQTMMAETYEESADV